jgi:phage/plasmid-associated DNA primase
MFRQFIHDRFGYTGKDEVGKKATHVIKDVGKYYVSKNDMPQFWDWYCLCLDSGIEKLFLAEMPDNPCPFRLDIDIHAENEPDDDNVHLYTMDDVALITETARLEIAKLVSSSEEDHVYKCVVLEKPKYRSDEKKGGYKDGFHIHFPWLCLESWSFEVLRKYIHEALPLNFTAKFKLDEGISVKAWIMYGGGKDEHSLAYLASLFLGSGGEMMEAEEFFRHDMRQLPIKGSPKKVEYYFPMLLSIKNRPKTVLCEKFRKRKTEVSIRAKKVPRLRTEAQIMQDLHMVKEGEFMHMLSQHRVEDRKLWLDVGFTLFNIAEGCEEGLDLWIEFSMRSTEKFEEGVCEKLWNRMDMRGKTIGSLIRMLQEDAPEKFGQWQSGRITNKLNAFGYQQSTPQKLANLFVGMYKHKYVHVGGKGDMWYEFRDHRWRKIVNAISVKRTFAKDIKSLFVKHLKNIKREEAQNEESDANGDPKKKKQVTASQRIATVIRDLEFPKTINQAVEMCKLDLHDPEFVLKLNKNRYMLGCENGVLDLTPMIGDDGVARPLGIFREGRPDDYISKSTRLYYKEYTGSEPEVGEFEQIMHKLYPIESVRNFVYDVWRMTFGGRNTNKFFVVSVGPPNAGKTGIHAILKTALGEYAIKSPSELIQRGNRNSSGGVRPDLMRLSGVRANIFDEISDRSIDPDAIKRQTGNEEQWGRGLQDNDGEEIKPTCVTFLQTNRPPRLPTSDDALWKRMKIVQHTSTFESEGYPEDEAEQWRTGIFKADLHLDERYPLLASVLLWKIFHNFTASTSDTIVVPKEIEEATELYKRENDIYMEFVVETMQKSGQEEGDDSWVVSVGEVFDTFRVWYEQNVSKGKIRRDVFVRELSRVLKQKPEGKTKIWKGWRLDVGQSFIPPPKKDKTKIQ